MTGKPSGRGGARPGAGRKPKAKTAEIKREKIQTSTTSGRRGGARPGAGRKPKEVEKKATKAKAVSEHLEPQPNGGALKRKKAQPVEISDRDMLALLQDVALGRIDATNIQVRAAIAAVQYTHQKMGDGGKKDEKADAAKKAANKFATTAPPKLVINNRK